MKETTLWGHLKPELKRHGKFQKISDRFTPGVPDVLGCSGGTGFAIELKEFSGARIVKAHFRPGQLDWLRDWSVAGGTSWIFSTLGQTVYVFPHGAGYALEVGISLVEATDLAIFKFTKNPKTRWSDFVIQLIGEV